MNSREYEKAELWRQIQAKEMLLQKRDGLTTKIDLLIEKLNS